MKEKVKISDLLIVSLDRCMAFDINNGGFRFTLDELQNLTIANTQGNDEQTGRNGRTIGTLKRNKAVKVSGTNGMVSLGLVEAELGTEGEHKTTSLRVPEFLTVGNTTSTSFKAVGTPGNEIGEIFVKNSSGATLKTLVQDSAVSEGKFTYDPDTKEIEFYMGDPDANIEGDVEVGDSIVFYYDRLVEADVIINDSENYSETLELYIDATAKDKCKNIYRVQYKIFYADFSGNFETAMGDSQAVHNFEATSLPNTCGNDSTQFYDMIVVGLNAEDVIE